MLKRAISIILILATLFTFANLFISCSDKSGASETEKHVFEHTETTIVETEGETVTLNGKDQVELSFFPATNLSEGMEIVFNLTAPPKTASMLSSERTATLSRPITRITTP